jgi:hypothetical protein
MAAASMVDTVFTRAISHIFPEHIVHFVRFVHLMHFLILSTQYFQKCTRVIICALKCTSYKTLNILCVLWCTLFNLAWGECRKLELRNGHIRPYLGNQPSVSDEPKDTLFRVTVLITPANLYPFQLQDKKAAAGSEPGARPFFRALLHKIYCLDLV